MSSGFSDVLIDEAEAAIKSEQSHYQASQGERTLDVIEKKISAISSSEPVSIMQNAMLPVASAEFLIVKDGINNFVENSKILMSVLDEVGKAHPFIQAALVIFKAGIQLEITRRQNDEKVLALNMTMCDMMSVLRLLNKITTPKEFDGLTIGQRLQGKMVRIIDSIKSCAKLCDSYQKRNVAVKFFTSMKWRQRFTDLAEQFMAHQNAIQSDLQLYISGEITNTNKMLLTLNKNVTSMMEMVFDRMLSPEERELADFVQNKGGVATSPDDKLLQEVIKNFQQQQKEDKMPIKGGPVADKMPIKGSPVSDFPTDLSKFKMELGKEIGDILEENSEVFERSFGAIENSLREVKETIKHEGDRVIETVLAGVNRGPQERIKDKDLYHVWQEMGWRGSVKATHLVMAINDHFTAKSNVAINEIHVIANDANSRSPVESLRDIASITQHAIPATPAEDLWSLRYITVYRSQPLIEAIDDDGSSFITVNEVNKFTTSRPKNWSVPRWIAYWTIGFEMTTQWYYRRIHRLLFLLSDSSKDVLPANRKVVSQFMNSRFICATEYLLAGCRNVSDWDGIDWAHDSLFLKFKPWVLENERKMNEVLRRLVYFIDQDNTLNTVTGGDRPETYVMPLLYLLMERSHMVMKRAHDVVLHHKELDILEYSMYSVHSAIRDRVEKLQHVYELQNIKREEKLQTVFFGLYAYTFEEPKKGGFWMQDPDQYDAIPEEPPSDLDIPEPELYYHDKPQIEELDFDACLTKNSDPESPVSNTDQEEPVPTTQASQSLVGAWSGTYSYELNGSTDGLVSFSITQHTSDDRFHCSGVDTLGPFTVNGRVNGEHVTFLKEYAEPQDGEMVSWQYKGLLNEERNEISGNWGPPLSDNGESLVSGRDKGDTQTEPGEQQGAVKERQDGDTVCDTPPTTDTEPATLKEKADEDMMGENCVLETGSPLANVSTDATETWMSYGTFVLYRRPVHYTFYRPSDDEFQENKPRALWKLVRNAARYWSKTQHLTWEGIRERRDKRQMYLELWRKKKSEYDTFTDPADKSKWEELVCAVHPDDLHLWYNIARFQDRREVAHTQICDRCKIRLEVHSSRIMCIECSEGEFWDTIDLCPNCQTLAESVYRKSDNKDHKPSHPMIQLRRDVLRIEVNSVMSHAKSRLEALPDEGVKYCTYQSCKKKLPGSLYWYCTQCEDDTFVCIECNNRFEKEKPWLLRRKAAPEHLHDWLHTMVLKPQAVEESDSPGLSTDERLTKLEAKLNKQMEQTRAFETSVAVRLHALEQLLDKQMEQTRAFETSVTVRQPKLEELLDKQMEQTRKLEELLQRVLN